MYSIIQDSHRDEIPLTWHVHLPPGRYRLRAGGTVSGGIAWKEVDLREDVVLAFDLPEDRLRMRIVVMNAEGKPASGVRFNVNRAADALEEVDGLPVQADDTGLVVLPPRPRGDYWIIFWDLSVARKMTLIPGQEVVLRLPTLPKGEHDLQVVMDPPPEYGADAYVRAIAYLRAAGEEWLRLADRLGGRLRYQFLDLPAGRYELVIPLDWTGVFGSPWREVRQVVDVGGGETEPIHVALQVR